MDSVAKLKMATQLAIAELNKTKDSQVTKDVFDAKVKEFLQLSDAEMQKRIDNLPSILRGNSKKAAEDLYANMGLDINCGKINTASAPSDAKNTLVKPSAETSQLPKYNPSKEELVDTSYKNAEDEVGNAQTTYNVLKKSEGIITKSKKRDDKLAQVIDDHQIGLECLYKAKNGQLTKKEYLDENRARLLRMFPAYQSSIDQITYLQAKSNRSLSEEQQLNNLKKRTEDVKERVNSLSPKALKSYQHRILMLKGNKTSGLYKQQSAKIWNDFQSDTGTVSLVSSKNSDIVKARNVKTIKPPYKLTGSEELMTYEQVFELEKGIKYDAGAIKACEENKAALDIVTGAKTNFDYISRMTNQFITSYEKETHTTANQAIAGNQSKPSENGTEGATRFEPDSKLRCGELAMIYTNYFNKDGKAALNYLSKIKDVNVKLSLDKDNKLVIEGKNRDVNELAVKFQEMQSNQYKKVLSGKKYEDYQNNYAQSYIAAYGINNPSELANASLKDQQEMIDNANQFVMGAGIGLTLVGGVTCLIPGLEGFGAGMAKVGGNIAMTAMAADPIAKTIDYKTSETGFTKERADALKEELATDAVFMGIGFVSGGVGRGVAKALNARGLNQVKSMMAERGTDFACNVMGGALMLGEPNLQMNALNAISAAMLGSRAYKVINKPKFKAVGDLVGKENTFSTDRLLGNKSPELKPIDAKTEAKSKTEAMSTETKNTPVKQPDIKGQENVPQSIEAVKVFDVKDIKQLVPKKITSEQLSALGKDMTIVKGKDSAGKEIRVLSNSADKMVMSVARTLHDDAVKNKDNIESIMEGYGFHVEGKFTGRSKKIQSLHDKIRTYIVEHPTESFTDAIRAVHDANGFRNVHFSTDVTKCEAVQKYLRQGDIKSAQIAAAEIQSEPIVEAFKSVILDMSKGHPKLSITTISNYIGEDGIPYFSERQLEDLEKFAVDHNVHIPVIKRAVAQDNRASLGNPYAKKATTKVRASGYSALQANFVTEKGDIFEFQFRGDKVNPFAEGEHVPYDLRNNKDIIGVNKELEILYNPMKELLSKDNMNKERYKEYNAYLTAHYKYCRLVELGFEKPGNPPKLPEGFDARLRADNLAKLHVIAEDLKDGKLTPEQAKARFESELIRNDEHNVTSHSYLEDLRTARKNARGITEYEARTRLVTTSHPENQAIIDACKDSKGNIKAVLVKGVEYLRSRPNVSDEMIIDFINKNKTPDGRIDPKIYKRFCLSLAKK